MSAAVSRIGARVGPAFPQNEGRRSSIPGSSLEVQFHADGNARTRNLANLPPNRDYISVMVTGRSGPPLDAPRAPLGAEGSPKRPSVLGWRTHQTGRRSWRN